VPTSIGCATINRMISVVVAVLDGLPWLDEQLAALAAQDCISDWEVVVADNGSTDASPATARSWVSRCEAFRLVDASARRGPAAARNIGVESARGDLLAFCDADDLVQPGWLEAMAGALADADVVAGAFELGSLNGGGLGIPSPAVTRQIGHLPAGLAANLGVVRRAFEAVGGFDENLRVGEDIDLCWRLQLAGFKFAAVQDAVVAKRERATGSENFRQGITHGRSVPRLYRKHRDAGIRRDLKGALKSWGWLVIQAPRLFEPVHRRRWLRVAGVRIGRLIGSAENRVFCP
jgi:GT2 family glycosyltransferase